MELVMDRLSKQFQNKIAVDRVSLRLAPGVTGLLGANGAGKTTLMRLPAPGQRKMRHLRQGRRRPRLSCRTDTRLLRRSGVIS